MAGDRVACSVAPLVGLPRRPDLLARRRKNTVVGRPPNCSLGILREVVGRLRAAGHVKDGDLDILLVFDSGYEVTRLAFLLADLPVQLLGRLRSGRVLQFPAPPPPDRAAGRARPGVQIRRPQQLAGTGGDHDQRHQPLRNRAHRNVGPIAPQVVPPQPVGRPRGATPDHRGNSDPADGGSPAR